jgi:hypothetical protein
MGVKWRYESGDGVLERERDMGRKQGSEGCYVIIYPSRCNDNPYFRIRIYLLISGRVLDICK